MFLFVLSVLFFVFFSICFYFFMLVSYVFHFFFPFCIFFYIIFSYYVSVFFIPLFYFLFLFSFFVFLFFPFFFLFRSQRHQFFDDCFTFRTSKAAKLMNVSHVRRKSDECFTLLTST